MPLRNPTDLVREGLKPEVPRKNRFRGGRLLHDKEGMHGHRKHGQESKPEMVVESFLNTHIYSNK